MPEYIESKECWTMGEVFEQTERLLADKCVVTIRQGAGSFLSGLAFLVTGTRNKELTEAVYRKRKKPSRLQR